MDILEFEIRYRSFEGLSQKFQLGRTEDQLFELCKITNKGQLIKKLSDTEPRELRELTYETYSDYKKSIIEESKAKNEKLKTGYTLHEYIERTEYELKVIKEMGFNSYLLVVADFVNRSKQNGVPVGPGRGSAAGSLIAWIMGITDVDPLPFALLFERFLNPARVSLPDIDLDFDDEQRERVFAYVREHYGHELVAKIGTFMNMSAKAAFKDVARVYGVPFELSNRISSFFTILNDDRTVNFRKCWEEVEELRAILDGDDEMKNIVDITDNLIGTYRQTGVHACGIIIGPDDLTNYLPQQLAPNTVYSASERNVTQYDYNVAKIEDNIGVIKMDFLGLGNLGIIKNAIKIIAKRYELLKQPLPEIFQSYQKNSVFEPDIHDIKVYETVFQKGNTTGIFQFESEGMKKFLILLKPDRLDDIVSMSALYRPGPIEFIPSFINRKQGDEVIEYMYPELYQLIIELYGEEVANAEKAKLEEDLKPVLENTYGVAVFQEQLMFMSQRVAGFSFAEADNLRRGIGKKIVALVKKMKEEFIEKAVASRGYKAETATWVFEKMIEPAALYSFNKSHSVAYSLVAFQTAYLKTYYPVEFHAALLRANEGNTDELSKFITEVKFQGLKLLGPDVNESYAHVAAIDDYIRLGFLCIKGVGAEVAETIQIQRQQHGPYKDLGDFLTRCSSVINRRSLESLVKSGALDSFVDRGAMLENMNYILERSKSSSSISDGGLFGGGFGKTSLELEVKHPLDKMSIVKLEYEVFKTFVSFHPLDGLYGWIKARGFNMISQFKNRNYDKEQKDFGAFTIVGIVTKITRAKKKGYFIKIEDYSDSIEFFVKEPLDIEEFDLLMISGYRGKGSPRCKKMIHLNLEKLTQIAKDGGKYDEQETVYEVKKKRLGITTVGSIGDGFGKSASMANTGDEDLGLEVVNLTAGETNLLNEKLLKAATSVTGEEVLPEEAFEDEVESSDNDSPSNDLSHDLENPAQDEQASQDNKEDGSVVHEGRVEEVEKVEGVENVQEAQEVEDLEEESDESFGSSTSSFELKSLQFDIPHDIQTIKKLQVIIRENPGVTAVNIGGMVANLSEQGIEFVRKLLKS